MNPIEVNTMSSLSILQDRLTQTEYAMESLSEQINDLNGSIESNTEHRDKIVKKFNQHDEETVELREAINLLKEARETHG